MNINNEISSILSYKYDNNNYIVKTISDIDEPSLEGYTFLGWSLTADGEILGNDTVLVSGSIYYARFESLTTN